MLRVANKQSTLYTCQSTLSSCEYRAMLNLNHLRDYVTDLTTVTTTKTFLCFLLFACLHGMGGNMPIDAFAASVSKSPGSTGPAALPLLVHPHPVDPLRSAPAPLFPCMPWIDENQDNVMFQKKRRKQHQHQHSGNFLQKTHLNFKLNSCRGSIMCKETKKKQQQIGVDTTIKFVSLE